MKIIYLPNKGDGIAFALLVPENTNNKLVLEIAIHGMGERSAGTQENLENLVLGQKQPDGSRKWPFVFDDMKKAVDQYGILMAIPAYSGFMEPTMINKVYEYCKANFDIYERMILTGFSLGGGAVVKYITSSLSNAQRVAYAVPCAATRDIMDRTIPGKAGVSVHLVSNDNDPTVNVSNTKAIYTAINESNPPLKALMTIFDRDGHGANEVMWGVTAPKAPGGQGLIDSGENMYVVGVDSVINGPRQMRAGTPIPMPPPTPEPSPAVNPVTSYTIDAAGIHLRGDKSVGYKSGMEGKWEFISGPAGANVRNVFPNGSTYINADGKLPYPGTYVFRFILKGASPVDVTVVSGGAQPAPKTVVAFNSATDTITYSDGSTEKGEAVLSGGKWTLKNSTGGIVI